jgi:hypothetical protein
MVLNYQQALQAENSPYGRAILAISGLAVVKLLHAPQQRASDVNVLREF